MLSERAQEFHAQQLLMELILSHLLDPNPSPLPEVYWRGLTIWALRSSASIAAFLGRSVHRLFLNMHKLTLEACERLAIWFGYHLSNTGFEWPWPAWEHVSQQSDPSHSQRYFVEMALHQGVRLSYYDCVDHVLACAPGLRSLLPNPMILPSFPVEDEESRDRICALIQDKAPFSELLQQANDSLEMVFKCILWRGQKTYSHLFSRLRIYESDIGGALQSMQMPSEIVGWVADFWATSSQHVLVIVDRLLRHFVLNPEHIVAWIFNSYEAQKMSDHSLFTLLNNAVDFAQEHFDETMLSDLMILIIQHFSQLVVSLSAKETLLNERFESFLHRFPRTIGRFSVVIASEAFIGTSRLQSIFAEEAARLQKQIPEPKQVHAEEAEMDEDAYRSE